MIYYIGIAAICVFYFLLYIRHFPSHPIIVFFLFVAVYIPFKYFLVEGLDIGYVYSLDMVGERFETPMIHYGGLLLFIYFAGSALTHFLCQIQKVRVPIIRVVPRANMVPWSIILLGFMLLMVVALNGLGIFADHSKTRMAFESKGMGYLMVLYMTVTTIAFVQVADRGNLWHLIGFGLVCLVLFAITDRTAVLIGWVQLLVIYAVMVRRFVPQKALFTIGPVLPVVAILQGFTRVRGGLTAENLQYMGELLNQRESIKIVASQIVGRIDPLERFCFVANLLREKLLAPDPMWPLYVLVQFVPRAVWPDKPFFFNNHMMSMYFPASFEAGVSFNFLGPSEMLYSFGLIGLVPAFLLTGYVLHVIDRNFTASRGDSGVFLFFYIVIWQFFLLGFNVGWLNNVALSFAILNMVLLFLICRVYVVNQVDSDSQQ